MPNHFHGIVVINNNPVGADLCVCPNRKIVKPVFKKGEHTGSPLQGMIQWFKTMTTNEYIRGVKSHIYPPFEKRLWQRNYHEHVIRNEEALEKIQNYIVHNPEKWADDKFYRSI